MNIKKATAIIKKHEQPISKMFTTGKKGFMVSFEEKIGGILASKHFPDKHAKEKLIRTEEYAWNLAKRFANATDPLEIVNIYVIDETFSPVKNYYKKTIRRY